MSKRLIVLLVAAILTLFAGQVAGGDLAPLSTSGQWLPGKFIWGDLATDDVEAAQKFYGGLLGWEFSSVSMGKISYTIALNNGSPLCGMVQVKKREDAKGHPRWIGYISVPDVDQARQAVLKAGGRELLAPRMLPKRGEQAIFSDPEGAVFGVMKSSAGDPEDFLAEPGEWIWIQLLSRDPAKAGEFYSAVAGYEVVADPTSESGHRLLLVAGTYARATVMEIPKDRPSLRPVWLPFVRVADIKASVSKAPQLGGKVLVAPKEELFHGKLAVVADPTGAAIGLIEWDTTETQEGEQP